MNQVSNNPIRLIYVNLIAILLSQKNPKSKSWKMLKARLELICWWVTSCTFKLLKLTFDFQLSCTTLIGLKKKMCNKTIWSLIFGISCFQFSYLEMKSHISDEGVSIVPKIVKFSLQSEFFFPFFRDYYIPIRSIFLHHINHSMRWSWSTLWSSDFKAAKWIALL